MRHAGPRGDRSDGPYAVTEGGFPLETSSSSIEARNVVLATGAYQSARRPGADSLPTDLLQIDVGGYVAPDRLPDGPVLIVGSGQSGYQIAWELHDSGRDVFLSCGRAPWFPRRIGDHDDLGNVAPGPGHQNEGEADGEERPPHCSHGSMSSDAPFIEGSNA